MTTRACVANRYAMKLATYNLNGIRARLPRLLEWLGREQPDIVALQELKCADEALPIAYIEAEGKGIVVGSLYLPNGNPVGTEKFDYKIRWAERLCARAAELLEEERPAVLCGDWKVVPEDRDVFSV